jgi:hypothetical protein
MDASDQLERVEAMRAQGLSVVRACQAVGISTATYYRKRKAMGTPEGPEADQPADPGPEAIGSGPPIDAAPSMDPRIAALVEEGRRRRAAQPERQRLSLGHAPQSPGIEGALMKAMASAESKLGRRFGRDSKLGQLITRNATPIGLSMFVLAVAIFVSSPGVWG